VNVLRTRENLPLVTSICFFPMLLANLIRHRNPGLALIVSIVKVWKPKVIITYIDNTRALGALKQILPDTRMISVQNGTRWDLSLPDQPHLDFDHYFSFGRAENDIFVKGGHSATRVVPVGSLRAGIFVDTVPPEASKAFDLCFISQFTLRNGNLVSPRQRDIHTAYFETDRQLFNTVARFSRANDLKLCIAMRYPANSPAFEEERQYFSLDDESHVQVIARSPYSSYRAVRASRLSVTTSSSLGYESLGLGERVIFAKDVKAVASLVMQGTWTENLVTYRLPDLQRLSSLDYDEFSAKATALLSMGDEEYSNYSREARAYYMNIDPLHLPHEIIKHHIEEFLAPTAVTHQEI
jgi:surface carbohydrate biosynthesis protein